MEIFEYEQSTVQKKEFDRQILTAKENKIQTDDDEKLHETIEIEHTFYNRNLGLNFWYDENEKAMRVIKISQKSELSVEKHDIVRHMILKRINEEVLT